MGWNQLPNAITAARMLLAVPLAWCILERRFDQALVITAIAGASDALDGFLAKRFRWQSWIGGVLDPIADKLMLLAATTALTLEGAIPQWVFALVVGRDLLIVGGALAYHNLVGRVEAAPTRISKLTTFLQICYVLSVLVDLTRTFELPHAVVVSLMVAVAVATVTSGLHYVVTYSLRARAVALERKT